MMRFRCQSGCTKCCEQRGFVYLTEEDITRLAEHEGMNQSAFEERYVYRTAKQRRLRVPRRRHCPFLTSEGCSVHEAKPLQCRAFPFWPEMVDSRREWEKTGRWCPGIGQGPLVSIAKAQQIAQTMRDADPDYYK